MNPTNKANGEDDDIVLAQIVKSIAEYPNQNTTTSR
jgi:hypothetical protein